MEISSENDQPLVTSDMLEGLPEPVQRYLTYTGLVGYPWIDTVRLEQVGIFRQGADRPGLPPQYVPVIMVD